MIIDHNQKTLVELGFGDCLITRPKSDIPTLLIALSPIGHICPGTMVKIANEELKEQRHIEMQFHNPEILAKTIVILNSLMVDHFKGVEK